MFHQPGNEMKVAFAVLRAKVPLGIRAGQTNGRLYTVLIEDLLENIRYLLFLKNAEILGQGHKPHFRDYAQPVGLETLVLSAYMDLADDAAEVPYLVRGRVHADGNGRHLTEQVPHIDRC